MNDSFALRDLIDFSKGVFVVLPVMVNEANEAAIKFSRKCQKHTYTEGKAPVASGYLVRQSKIGGDNTLDQITNFAPFPMPSTDNYSTECSVDCGTS